MDQKFPFTSYDFWAYLSSGFLLLFVADHAIGTNFFAKTSWTVVQSIVAVSMAYVTGHLVASISSLVWERYLVGRLLGYPRNVLLGQANTCRLAKKLLPGYYQSLPEKIKQDLLARSKGHEIKSDNEALFLLAFTCACRITVTRGRLDNFINLYGFCRNIALVASIDAVILFAAYYSEGCQEKYLYFSFVAAMLSVGMTLRYLKFYRQYCAEIYTAFACGEIKE